MDSTNQATISVHTIVDAPVKVVWRNWTTPEAILHWNNASDDWHTTRAENDLRAGGKFISRMEAKDGSFGFDFEGIYDVIIENEYIEYHLGDGRKVKTTFICDTEKTKVTEVFDAESTNPIELQRDGWQAILNNFKKYTEKKYRE